MKASNEKSILLLKIFASLSIVGFAVLLMSFFALGANIFNVVAIFSNDDKYTHYEQTLDDASELNEIVFNIENRNVMFEKNTENKVHISYYVLDDISYSYDYTDGKISFNIDERLYRQFSILPQWTSNKVSTVSVSLPHDYDKTLNIKTTNGKISLEGFNLKALSFESTNGQINVSKSSGENVLIKSTNGKISLDKLASLGSITVNTTNNEIDAKNLEAESITLNSTNGEINLKDSASSDSISCETTNNEIELEDIHAKSISLTTTNGSIELENIISDTINANTTNNKINAKRIDCSSLEFISTNGRISLGLTGTASAYNFDLITSSSSSITVNGSKANGKFVFGSGESKIKCKTSHAKIEISTK